VKQGRATANAQLKAHTVASLFVPKFACQFGVPDYIVTRNVALNQLWWVKIICKVLGVIKTPWIVLWKGSTADSWRCSAVLPNIYQHWGLHLPFASYVEQASKSTGDGKLTSHWHDA